MHCASSALGPTPEKTPKGSAPPPPVAPPSFFGMRRACQRGGVWDQNALETRGWRWEVVLLSSYDMEAPYDM